MNLERVWRHRTVWLVLILLSLGGFAFLWRELRHPRRVSDYKELIARRLAEARGWELTEADLALVDGALPRLEAIPFTLYIAGGRSEDMQLVAMLSPWSEGALEQGSRAIPLIRDLADMDAERFLVVFAALEGNASIPVRRLLDWHTLAAIRCAVQGDHTGSLRHLEVLVRAAESGTHAHVRMAQIESLSRATRWLLRLDPPEDFCVALQQLLLRAERGSLRSPDLAVHMLQQLAVAHLRGGQWRRSWATATEANTRSASLALLSLVLTPEELHGMGHHPYNHGPFAFLMSGMTESPMLHLPFMRNVAVQARLRPIVMEVPSVAEDLRLHADLLQGLPLSVQLHQLLTPVQDLPVYARHQWANRPAMASAVAPDRQASRRLRLASAACADRLRLLRGGSRAGAFADLEGLIPPPPAPDATTGVVERFLSLADPSATFSMQLVVEELDESHVVAGFPMHCSTCTLTRTGGESVEALMRIDEPGDSGSLIVGGLGPAFAHGLELAFADEGASVTLVGHRAYGAGRVEISRADWERIAREQVARATGGARPPDGGDFAGFDVEMRVTLPARVRVLRMEQEVFDAEGKPVTDVRRWVLD